MIKSKKPPDSIYKTIKVPLKSILRNHDEIVPKIDQWVQTINQITTLAYQMIRLFVITKYEAGDPIPELNKELCQMVLSIVSKPNSKGRKPKQTMVKEELKTFYEKEFLPLLQSDHQRIPSDKMSEIITKVGVEMSTSYDNNVAVHFVKRLHKYLKCVMYEHSGNPTDKEGKEKVYQMVKTLMDGIWTKERDLVASECVDLYDECLKNYLPSEPYSKGKKDKIGTLGYDLKVNPSRYLMGTLNLHRKFVEIGLKSFQPLSLRNGYVPKYIPINIKALIYLLDFSDLNPNKGKLISEIKTRGTEIWNKYFDLDHSVFNQGEYIFYNRMDTDGVGCSLTFVHHKYRHLAFKPRPPINQKSSEFPKLSELNESEIKEFKTRSIAGGDPGKFILLQLVDSLGKHLRYTSKQRRAESYGNDNRKIIDRMKDEGDIRQFEQLLCEYSGKTLLVKDFKEFVIVKSILDGVLRAHYNDLTFRKLRLRSFIYRKKSLDRFLRAIKKTFGKDVIIGYGNWSRTSQMKYNPPTMGKGLRRIIHRWFLTLTVDEYNTSKKCYWCEKELENRRVGGKKLHRCLICEECHSSESGKNGVARRFINRDINGALNIHRCIKNHLLGIKRPLYLSRGSSEKSEGSKGVSLKGIKKSPIKVKLMWKKMSV